MTLAVLVGAVFAIIIFVYAMTVTVPDVVEKYHSPITNTNPNLNNTINQVLQTNDKVDTAKQVLSWFLEIPKFFGI